MKEKQKRRESPSGVHFYSLYQDCPRKHYIKYGLGLRPTFTGKALIMGGSLHEAVEVYYRNWDTPSNDLIDRTNSAFQADLSARQEEYAHEDDFNDDFERGVVLLTEWHNTWYKHDKKSYLLVELENQREVYFGPENEFVLTIRPDRVFENILTGRKHVADVKTTGWSIDGSFKSAEALDQMTAYVWALTKCEPDWTIEDVIIDVLFVRKSRAAMPKVKFPNPRAERPGRIRLTSAALKQFELGMYGTIAEVSQKYANLNDFPAEMLFPRNGGQCAKFGCEYYDICRTQLQPTDMPDGFERDEWKNDLEKVATLTQGIKE